MFFLKTLCSSLRTTLLPSVPAATSLKMSSLTTAIGEFSMDLFEQLVKQDKGQNILFSPLDVKEALSLLQLGAKGPTADEFEKILHWKNVQHARTGDLSATELEHNAFWLKDASSQCDEPGGIPSQLHAMLSQLIKPTKDRDLNIINRLFGAKHFDFYPQYLHCIKQLYSVDLEQVDFGKETEKTRLQINSWAASQTHGKIQELLAPGSLDPNAALVLVNASSFKGKWKFGFKEEDTKEAPFWVNKNETKMIQMMYKKGKFNMGYISDHRSKILELPYGDREQSMIILLPDETEDTSSNMDEVLQYLTYKQLKDWIEMTHITEVELSLPRFKLEEKYKLKPVLSNMGMAEAFDQSKADFSGMSSNKDLFLSEIVHKFFVEVNEEGTEAAAATATIMLQKPQFIADRPFLFFICNNLTGSILSSGRFSSS